MPWRRRHSVARSDDWQEQRHRGRQRSDPFHSRQLRGGGQSLPCNQTNLILTYLSTAHIHAEDALYIGDTLYDCQCAQNARVDFGLAAWGNAATQEIPADYIFKRPADVQFLLSGNSKPRYLLY